MLIGEWIEENPRPKSSAFYCSACHRTAYDPQPNRKSGWVKRCRYAYCPNCGARMTGTVDDKATIELPCKIWDALYKIVDDTPKKYTVERISLIDSGMIIHAKDSQHHYMEIIPEQIGADVYRTMDEAIGALRAIKKRQEEAKAAWEMENGNARTEA